MAKENIFVKFSVIYSFILLLGLQVHGNYLQLRQELLPPSDLESSFDLPPEDYRLPNASFPKHYKLIIQPILDNNNDGDELFTVPGSVQITLNCTKATKNITLHSQGLSIDTDSVKVTRIEDTREMQIVGQYFEISKDFYIIELQQSLEVGKEYLIDIPLFVAPLSNDEIQGFFVRSYADPSTGETRYFAMTKFEPYHARRSFPCLDEPYYKATFEISVARKENYHSLSNVDIKESIPDPSKPGWILDNYEPTELMPPSMVGILISEFTSQDADADLYEKPVKVWTPSYNTRNEDGAYAADLVAKMLNYSESQLFLKYTLPKMDSVIIPETIVKNVEHWGLNTYQETNLMYYEGISTEADRWRIDTSISKQIGGQWFGNLATCKWWSDIWLHKGLSTYWGFHLSKQTSIEFEPTKRFFIDVYSNAMHFDHGSFAHPIHLIQPTRNDESEVPAKVYDAISHEKASSIIRMVESWVDTNVFKMILFNYLNEARNSSTEQNDLVKWLRNLEALLPPDLKMKEIIDSWTLQVGYPLVRVNKIGDFHIMFSQEQYFTSLNAPKLKNVQYQSWVIPISIAGQAFPDFTRTKPVFWLRKNQLSYIYRVQSPEELQGWILINLEAMGFYRVLYDAGIFSHLLEQLNQDALIIPPVTRAQLLDNYFNFAYEGHAKIEDALALTKYFDQEDDLTAWIILFRHLESIFLKFSGQLNGLDHLKNYLLPKVDKALNKIGLEQPPLEIGSIVTLRSHLLDWACSLDQAECLNYAEKSYQAWKNVPDGGPNPIPADIRAVMYCGAVSSSLVGAEAFAFFYEKYRKELNYVERQRLLNSLACSKDEALLKQILDDATNPASSIRTSDRIPIMNEVVLNPLGRSVAFQYISENLGKNLLNANVYTEVVATMSEIVSMKSELDRITEDIKTKANKLSNVMDRLEATLAKMMTNVVWMSETGNRIQSWMDANIVV